MTRCGVCGAPHRRDDPYCSDACGRRARVRLALLWLGTALMILIGILGALGALG
jgi:predicted nucleic acid-binding Zn ribbon protein